MKNKLILLFLTIFTTISASNEHFPKSEAELLDKNTCFKHYGEIANNY